MRQAVLIALLAVATYGCSANTAAPASAPSSPIKVLLVVPEDNIWEIQNDQSHLDVAVENVSDAPIELYDGWNSWGWCNVSLEWEVDGAKGTVVHNPVHMWSKNLPSTTMVPSGAVVIFPVSLERDWVGWPNFDVTTRKITVRAVYVSKEKGPGWVGSGSSAPVTLTVRAWGDYHANHAP